VIVLNHDLGTVESLGDLRRFGYAEPIPGGEQLTQLIGAFCGGFRVILGTWRAGIGSDLFSTSEVLDQLLFCRVRVVRCHRGPYFSQSGVAQVEGFQKISVGHDLRHAFLFVAARYVKGTAMSISSPALETSPGTR
jgi:hypothetical protein